MLKRLLIFCVLGCLLLGAAAADTMYVDGRNADRVHLRADDSQRSRSMGLYFTGTPVEEEATYANGWSLVRIGQEEGYIQTRYLSYRQQPLHMTGTVISDGYLNLRLEPDIESASLNRLRDGQVLQLLGETSSGWYYVNVPATGQNGYVMAQFLEEDKPARSLRLPGNMPLSIAAYDGGTPGRRFIHIDVDWGADGFVLETLRGVQWLTLDRVDWIDDVTPQFTPIKTMPQAANGTSLHVRAYVPDGMPNLAITCCTGGVFATWYIDQSGENGDYLLIPASAWY